MQTLLVVASAWRWNIAGLICCGALLALGLRPSRRLVWFISGVFFFGVVVSSPLDVLARQYLFTAEAVEQVLISLVAGHLIILGMPVKKFPRLPYYVAWAAGMAALSMWSLPRLLNATLASDAVRGLEYATLLIGGVLFWWPLHAPLREQRIPMVPNQLLYLVAATVWCSLIGLYLAFEQPLSTARYLTPVDTLHIADSLVNDWAFTRETDQQTAGLLFWIGSASVLLTEVMFVYYRWYISSEVRNEAKS